MYVDAHENTEDIDHTRVLTKQTLRHFRVLLAEFKYFYPSRVSEILGRTGVGGKFANKVRICKHLGESLCFYTISSFVSSYNDIFLAFCGYIICIKRTFSILNFLQSLSEGGTILDFETDFIRLYSLIIATKTMKGSTLASITLRPGWVYRDALF